jgi:hypothetical protein
LERVGKDKHSEGNAITPNFYFLQNIIPNGGDFFLHHCQILLPREKKAHVKVYYREGERRIKKKATTLRQLCGDLQVSQDFVGCE